MENAIAVVLYNNCIENRKDYSSPFSQHLGLLLSVLRSVEEETREYN